MSRAIPVEYLSGQMVVGFFLAQIVALLAGSILLIALGGRRLPLGLYIPSAWLAGTGLLAVEYLLFSQMGLPWSGVLLALPWLAVAVVAALRLWRSAGSAGAEGVGRRQRVLPRLRASFSPGLVVDWGVALVIIAYVVALWRQATNTPLAGWDAWAMWFFKGRAMFLEGAVPTELFTDVDHYGYYGQLDYPLLVPLTIARTYAWAGDYDPLMKGWWPLLAGAAAAGIYWGLSGLVGRPARLGGLLLVLTLPDLANHAAGYYGGYADLPLAVYFLYGSIFIYRWLRSPSPGAPAEFCLSALFFSLAGFTKDEGLVVAGVGLATLVGLGLVRRRLQWVETVTAGVMAALVLVPWQAEIMILGIERDIEPTAGKIATLAGERLTSILLGLGHAATSSSHLNLLWPVLPLLLVATWVFAPRRWLAVLPLIVLIGAQIGAATIAYIVTPRDLQWHLHTSTDRVIFQVSLVALLAGTICLGLLLDRVEPRDIHGARPSSPPAPLAEDT